MDNLPSDRIRNGGPFVVSLRRNPNWSMSFAGLVACTARCWDSLSAALNGVWELARSMRHAKPYKRNGSL